MSASLIGRIVVVFGVALDVFSDGNGESRDGLSRILRLCDLSEPVSMIFGFDLWSKLCERKCL